VAGVVIQVIRNELA